MADNDQQRNEQPTPWKLEQARRKGSVPKGADLNAFLALATLTGMLYHGGRSLSDGMLRLCATVLSSGWGRMSEADPLALPAALFAAHLRLLAGLIALLMAIGALGCLVQTGPVFSFTPLKPDLQRVNPVAGAKRFFQGKLLLDALRAVLKALLLALAIGWFIRNALPTLLALPGAEPRMLAIVLCRLVLQLLLACLAVLVPIVVLDILFSRRDYMKRMRMSRRELLDEHKQREGDPRIRARRRALQNEARTRSSSLRRVKEADVLITNPTRLAVALKYDEGEMAAPVVLAKGAGELAALMREMAWRHRVPVVRNRDLARQLFRSTGMDQPIHPACYQAVARVLLWLRAGHDQGRLRNQIQDQMLGQGRERQA
ncbi:EscU/YscU/HrcU family type III secretion system export apparatus switch protein [Lacisediminimonas profundi]|uniref:EscU/YscU/HrcU family type III secretion system export apparatus switch protein n=1 Tax=Lacisediminimonas profundi TaxID=2603856 RepID=UPI00124AF3E8|nr:EscU/YscU/HrcU family type III secretion system export apparatus switch protein [Lacisediminimonas profundi]